MSRKIKNNGLPLEVLITDIEACVLAAKSALDKRLRVSFFKVKIVFILKLREKKGVSLIEAVRIAELPLVWDKLQNLYETFPRVVEP